MSANNISKPNFRHNILIKLTLGIAIVMIVVCFIVFSYIRIDRNNQKTIDLKELAKVTAVEKCNEVKVNLNEDIGKTYI